MSQTWPISEIASRKRPSFKYKKAPDVAGALMVFSLDQYLATTGPPKEYPIPAETLMSDVRLGGS